MHAVLRVSALPYLICCLALFAFIVAVVARIVMWSRLPMHLRWELYPVARESRERARYGGSYMEETEWWNKPRRTSTVGELVVIAKEVLFLSALKRHNPRHWIAAFPFHFGLYAAGSAAGLALFRGALSAAFRPLLTSGLGVTSSFLIGLLGVSGSVLVVVGALGLLLRRCTDPFLKQYTTSADVLNLASFIVAFGTGLVTYCTVDRGGSRAIKFAANLVSLKWDAIPGAGIDANLPLVTVILLSALAAYIPITHMSHFVGKYFAYHAVRWNHVPNLKGSLQEATIRRHLMLKVTWAAEHIRADGNTTWVDVAMTNPADKGQ